MVLVFGAGVGTLEEFFVQSRHGHWLSRMHPLASLLIVAMMVLAMAATLTVVINLLWGTVGNVGHALRVLMGHLPALFITALAVQLALRIIHFIGGRNLFYLAIGRFHRPVEEKKILAFIDTKGSTAIIEKLGPFKGRTLMGRALFDLSRIVSEHNGEVYVYTGDGLVAIWDWKAGIAGGSVLDFARATLATFERDRASYEREFGVAPAMRIGIHGGPVVISQQGDTRRAIGVYGETINIAARLEQAGKEVGADCLVSADIVEAIGASGPDLNAIAPLMVKGISRPIAAFAFRPAMS